MPKERSVLRDVMVLEERRVVMACRDPGDQLVEQGQLVQSVARVSRVLRASEAHQEHPVVEDSQEEMELKESRADQDPRASLVTGLQAASVPQVSLDPLVSRGETALQACRVPQVPLDRGAKRGQPGARAPRAETGATAQPADRALQAWQAPRESRVQ